MCFALHWGFPTTPLIKQVIQKNHGSLSALVIVMGYDLCDLNLAYVFRDWMSKFPDNTTLSFNHREFQ